MLRSLRSRLKPVVRDAVGVAIERAGMTKPRFDLLTIVTFHRVLPSGLLDQYPLPERAVTPEDFRWFMEWFTDRYSCGTLEAIYPRFRKGDCEDRPYLVVSFDGAELDNYLYAKPELDRMGVKGSFFVPVSSVEEQTVSWTDRLAYSAKTLIQRSPQAASRKWAELGLAPTSLESISEVVRQAMQLPASERADFVSSVEASIAGAMIPDWDGIMSWEQILSLHEEGHEVGSRSLSHRTLPDLETSQLKHEVEESKRILEEKLQRPVGSFCYPNGAYDDVAVTAVAKAGYRQAVTNRWGPNRGATPPHALTRCSMHSKATRSTVGHLSRSRLAWQLSPYYKVAP